MTTTGSRPSASASRKRLSTASPTASSLRATRAEPRRSSRARDALQRLDAARQALSEPHRQAPADAGSCSSLHNCASRRSGKPVPAEVGGERLGHDHPPARGDRDPVAVERHLDSAIGTKPRMLAMRRPRAGRRRGERRRSSGGSSCVEQGAMLAEPMLAAPESRASAINGSTRRCAGLRLE